MSQLDDLLSRSRSPGRFVERRAFTLSRKEAIEKQRAFALRLPAQYVLEIVQAAVFAGASYIAVDTRPESLLVAWVGAPPLEPRQLRELLDYLFADRTRADIRHLVQLAVGVNALLQKAPKIVRIESGDGTRSVRMDLDRSGEGTVGEVEEPIGGTYLYVEFALGLFGRWRTRRHTDEQQLVEERCLYTPVPILLNGSAPFGYRGSRHIEIFGARRQQHFDTRKRRGVIALHTNPRAPTGFRIVVGGVWIATLPLEELATQPLVGVVCDDNLRKTADHADIVLDHRYIELLHRVQPHATKLMKQLTVGTYTPPKLPPIPRAAPEDGGLPAESADAEPIPDAIPMHGVRGAVTPAQLDGIDAPVFHVPPDRAAELGRSADPVRFPWRLLLLTDGQATTLRALLPDLALHRVTAAADLDFVRRMAEQRAPTRRAEVRLPTGASLTLALHAPGEEPSWGDGRGIPFAIVAGDATLRLGRIRGRRVAFAGPGTDAAQLELPLRLPSTSLVLRLPADADGPMVDHLLDGAAIERVLDAAWPLAAPRDGPTHGALLAALLGQVAHPTFRPDGVDLHLPIGWPPDLLDRRALPTAGGDRPVRDLLRTPGSARTLRLVDDAAPLAWEPLEDRIGFGHLGHRSLDGRVVCAVVLVGNRWIPHRTEDLTGLPAVAALAVTPAFDGAPPAGWRAEPPLAPGIARWVDTGHPVDWDAARDALVAVLEEVDSEHAWARFAVGPVTRRRAAGRGRLALLQLAGDRDRALKVPAPSGDRVPWSECRRVVAAGGVLHDGGGVAVLTADERAAVDPERSVPAVYDDPPSLWAALADGGPAWLVRHKVDGDLQGWLGLRVPWDPAAGALLRSTTSTVALHELEREAPCHGLVRPTDDAGPTSHHLLRLEGLRLYQALARRLSDGTLDGAERAAAEAWAFGFAARAWVRTGSLDGLALELAQRVTLHKAAGVPWGSAAQWLDAPADARPPLPDGWLVPPEPSGPQLPATVSPTGFAGRLEVALPSLHVSVVWAPRDGRRPVRLVPEQSHRSAVQLIVDSTHPLAVAAMAGGRDARELLLLEAARVAVRHNRWIGQPNLLLRAQQALLASARAR